MFANHSSASPFVLATCVFASTALLAGSSAQAEERRTVAGAEDDAMRTLWVESPCPGPFPECQQVDLQTAYAQGRRIVYLAFDGVTLNSSRFNDDARSNSSAIVNSSPEVVPAFDPTDLLSTGELTRAEIIARVINDLYTIHSPYNIEFTTTRPSGGTYSMIVFGGTCNTVVGRDCAGIALRDCGDRNGANITFVFPKNLKISDLATTAAQEAAHAWGLGHTDDRNDVMFPRVLASVPDGYGAGNIMGADGNPDGSGCPSSTTFQDSHQKMLTNIGSRAPDTTSPTVNISNLSNGDTINPGFVVRATAADNIAVDRAALEFDGEVIREATDGPYEFALSALTPTGAHVLTVRAWDVNGNTGSAQVNVTIQAGNVTPCTTDAQCADGEHCAIDVCVLDTPDPGSDIFEICTSPSDCTSGICAEVDGVFRCTTSCADSSECPDGAECLGATACWPAADDTGTESGGGCRAATTSSGSAATGLIFLLMLVVLRRRRS